MNIVLAGEGAIARRHAAGLQRIDGVEVVGLAGGDPADTEAFANEFAIPTWTVDYAEALGIEADAVILATPAPLHATQAIDAMRAGRHVLVEIPMAESLADSEEVVRVQQETGLTAMVCHTRRFNPSHQWINQRMAAGELTLQHLVVETYFFRRENKNALGKPRTWTDHLLWHHACHTVDLFQYQTGERVTQGWAQQGPLHPELGIAMDMTVGMRVPSGPLCTLSLSFNNDGPLGTFFRYICDNGTYVARYDDLVDGYDNPVDLSGVAESDDGIELQDREFVAAIEQWREPNASVAQCLDAMITLDMLERSL